MNKYIIELLKTESTVIIPEFGALMMTGKSLIFNPILKFNDGKLIKYIAETENQDEVEVGNMVAKHVREIIADIGKGNTYSIFGLGSFYKNDEGKIVFESENDKKETSVPAVTLSVNEPEITQPIQPKKDINPEPIKEEKPITKEQIADEIYENTPQPEAKIPPVQKIIKEEEKVKPVSIKEADVRKVKPKPQEKPKKKKRGFILPLILLLLVGGAGAFTAIKWDMVKGWFGNTEVIADNNTTNEQDNNTETANHNNEVDDEMLLTDSLATDTTTATEEENDSILDAPEKTIVEEQPIEEEEVIEIEKTEVSSNLKYHITVGAFGSRENAETLVKKMKENGLPNARILPGNSKLLKVVAGSYATRSEAQVDIEKAKEYNPQAYVIKMSRPN